MEEYPSKWLLHCVIFLVVVDLPGWLHHFLDSGVNSLLVDLVHELHLGGAVEGAAQTALLQLLLVLLLLLSLLHLHDLLRGGHVEQSLEPVAYNCVDAVLHVVLVVVLLLLCCMAPQLVTYIFLNLSYTHLEQCCIFRE